MLDTQWKTQFKQEAEYSVEDVTKLVVYSIFSLCCAIRALEKLKELDGNTVFDSDSQIRIRSVNRVTLTRWTEHSNEFTIRFPYMDSADDILNKFDSGWKNFEADVNFTHSTHDSWFTTTLGQITIDKLNELISKEVE